MTFSTTVLYHHLVMATRQAVQRQDAVVHIRMYAEEKEAAYQLARRYRLSLSELVRKLLAKQAKRRKP